MTGHFFCGGCFHWRKLERKGKGKKCKGCQARIDAARGKSHARG